MKHTEVILTSIFDDLAAIKKNERKKARLENAGYTLVHQSASALVYKLK
jgi:hypothetical protein